jgi:putative nucleotidyltransferase with HDIG domain
MDDNKPSSKESGSHEEFDLKLLLDSSYPLLRDFRSACPGTFKHCQSVSSMIEGVSLSLELDVTEMKVMGQYHDIGKMINSEYFSENQLDEENPHKDLDPFWSYQIITRHVSDTTMILTEDDNFPKDLIKKMAQHHGTSILKFFCDFAGKEKNVDIETVEKQFRYQTHKPSSIEAMLLMICDNIEARSRSYLQNGKDFKPSDIIEKAINGLMSDGQLNAMTIGDLRSIKKALGKELEGTFQKRVSYPDDKEKTEE